MKYVIQLVSHQSGERSRHITTTQEKLAKVLRKNVKEKKVPAEDFILVIASVDEDNPEQMDLMSTPMHTIESLLKANYPEDYPGVEHYVGT